MARNRFCLRLVGAFAAITGAVGTGDHAAGPASAMTPAAAPVAYAPLTQAGCDALAGLDIGTGVGTPVQILSAKLRGGVCEIEGYANPQISFRLVLPASNWNGKLLEIGNGGMAGSFPDSYGAAGSGDPVAAGFAVIETDGGHRSSMLDARWADHNPSALIDYSYRAVHVASLVGKAIVARAYGRSARLAYFAGCSDGGREALMLAQHFPQDFNGIIAGAPSMRMANIYLNLYWMGGHVGSRRPGGAFSAGTLALLHRNALAQCARVSGLSHGNLVHPERCTVDVERLACTAKAEPGTCLTAAEIADAEAAYRGPRRADGSAVGPASAMPGSELEWAMMAIPAFSNYPFDVFRYIAFGASPAPGWRGNDLDLDAYPASMAPVEKLWSATDPDLRPFEARGGKLLSYMGWNDPVGGVLDTTDYHTTVGKLMGAKETAAFYRLFMVPGMAHCTGGAGAYRIDYLRYLDAWVEKGEAPSHVLGQHPDGPSGGAFEEQVPAYQ